MTEGGSTNLGSEDGGRAGSAIPEEAPDDKPRAAADWARIYAPQKTDGSYEDLAAKRKIGQGPILSSKLVRGRPVTREEATVPYQEALPTYLEAAEKAMNEGAIPAEYREQVRKYFEKLK